MDTYIVTAVGVSGREYVYLVKAKGEMSAACEAYAQHGQSLRDGSLSDPLGPHNTVELIESAVARTIRDAVGLKF